MCGSETFSCKCLLGGFKRDQITLATGSIGQNLPNTLLFSLSFLAKLIMEAFSHFMNMFMLFKPLISEDAAPSFVSFFSHFYLLLGN